MKILDLFCGGGGVARGFHLHGNHEVTGVDINPTLERYYPGAFITADFSQIDTSPYDFIWASPPCQRYSKSTPTDQRDNHPDLIDAVRRHLGGSGKPYCIENVETAPLRVDLLLCGEMFNLRVIRHRIFEVSGFPVMQPRHPEHNPGGTEGTRFNNHNYSPGIEVKPFYYLSPYGATRFPLAKIFWSDAMGFDEILPPQILGQAIPPAYSRYILDCFILSS